MKRVIIHFLLVSVVCALPHVALARCGTSSFPAFILNGQGKVPSKGVVYQRFLDNYKTDQPEAARAARLYLKDYSADNDERARYLRKWLNNYDKATGADGFRQVSIACGAQTTSRTYLVRRGGQLHHTVRLYKLAEQAEATLAELARAGEVVERTPVQNKQGFRVGERVVVKRASEVLVVQVVDKKLVSIMAPSVEVIEEFEKTGRP